MEKIKIENLEGEIWLPVVGYEGLYECSNLGRVKSVRGRKEHLMKQRYDKDGYLMLGLCKEGVQKFYQAHRLIGQAFLPNPSGLPEINHKNEIKDDNRVENIEWCSHLYNMRYGTGRQRAIISTQKPVQCIETGMIFSCAQDAINEMQLGIDKSGLRAVCRGKNKTAAGYHWRYV